MPRKKSSDDLALFEGEKVELADVRFKGDPDMLVQREFHDTPVAYMVLGTVSEIEFLSTEGNLTRRHKVKMRRVLQVPYERGIELYDELDRERLAGEGIHALPFPESPADKN